MIKDDFVDSYDDEANDVMAGQFDETEAPDGAIPLAPFFDLLFGDTLDTEEGRIAAAFYLKENKDEVAALFRDYIAQGETAKASPDLLALVKGGGMP